MFLIIKECKDRIEREYIFVYIDEYINFSRSFSTMREMTFKECTHLLH